MKEKIQIAIDNLDDIQSVLRSIELLFQKLIYYYGERNINNLRILVLSCAVWFGMVCQKLGLSEEDLND